MPSQPGRHRLVANRSAVERGWLRGPSVGLEAWTVYVMGVVDWMIDCRRRWHEAGPLPARRRWAARASGAAWLLAATLLVVRVLGG